MKECRNCGKPMIKDDDFGNNDRRSILCRFCCMDNSNEAKTGIEISIQKDRSLPGIDDLGEIDLL